MQWWEDGHRRKRTLGRVSEMTKTDAQIELAAILAPINEKHDSPSGKWSFGNFVRQIYLPFYRRKWKDSTTGTNEDRIGYHLLSEFSSRTLGSFCRDDLQDFLDEKADASLSFSTVDHLRWDLLQIFEMAVAESHLRKNPARLLFTPREAPRPSRSTMKRKEVKLLFAVLQLRERLICMLSTTAGMRPGEIFALKWKHLKKDHLEVSQRVYRGKIDSPKTSHSERIVALADGVQELVKEWRAMYPETGDEAWVFPSETLKTPLSKDNCWRRHVLPALKLVGLEWVNFQVMRRTHSSLMRELKVDPKVVADQLGHTVDVNLNVYTQTDLALKGDAVNLLESTLNGAEMEQIH